MAVLQVKGSPCFEQSKTAKRTTYEPNINQSNVSNEEELGRPAFKRFRHLITNSDKRANTPTQKLPGIPYHEEEDHTSTRSKVNSTEIDARNTMRSDETSKVDENVLNHVNYSERICDSVISISKKKEYDSLEISTAKVPAYQKFAHLVPTSSTTVDESSELGMTVLPLPYTYKSLLDFFKSMDNITNMKYNRKELLTFSALQDSIQKVVRRDFKEKTFGQIRTLYMGSFSARYEKNIPKFGRKVSANYELIVDVNLREDETEMSTSEETKIVYNGTRLVQRREKFLSKIMMVLFKKHREFLCRELNLLSSEIPANTKLKRWHPRFCLEKVEAPDAVPMPPRPDNEDKRIVSARDAVHMFREKGLIKESLLCEHVAVKCSGYENRSTHKGPVNKAANQWTNDKQKQLHGLPTSLLEKIRAKETAKLAALSRGGPDWEKKQLMLSRLPDLAMHTWNLFATNRKPVLSVSYLCEKIADSHSSGLSKSSVLDHLRLLAESLPEWLELLEWKIPHARILDMKRNLADVRGNLMNLRNSDAP